MAIRQCPKCSKKFRKRSSFLKHWRRKHDTRTTVWEAPTTGKRKGK